MWRKAAAVSLGLALAGPASAQDQAAVSDPEVARGIGEVEEGEYDAAILTLDAATRRLAGRSGRSRELAQAYLYLGVAYVAKGHESAARARFRESLTQLPELTLSPEKFPPKVIDLFEAARAEAGRTAATLASPPPAQKKGGGKALLIGAGVAAVGGGVAVALGGSGGDGSNSSIVEVFNDSLSPSRVYFDRTVGPSQAAGPWQATVTWSNRDSGLVLEVLDERGENRVAEAVGRPGQTQAAANWSGTAGASYKIQIYYDPDSVPAPGNVELRVQRPR